MYFDLVIIGTGISGLTAALEADKNGLKNVLLLDYQEKAGGFQSQLYPYSEFQEESKLLEAAKGLPYECWTESTVIGFFPDEEGGFHQLFVQKKSGTVTVEAKIVLIASGSVQKPREAVKIAGTRPFGVMTSILACNLVDKGFLPGENNILFERTRIDGAVKQKLSSDGMKVQSLPFEDYKLIRVNGLEKVSSIEVEFVPTGRHETIPCDAVLYSAGRIPSTFFLKQTPVERNEHLEVRVDNKGQTSVPAIFAIGSCTDKGDDDHFSSASMARSAMLEIIQVLQESQIK